MIGQDTFIRKSPIRKPVCPFRGKEKFGSVYAKGSRGNPYKTQPGISEEIRNSGALMLTLVGTTHKKPVCHLRGKEKSGSVYAKVSAELS